MPGPEPSSSNGGPSVAVPPPVPIQPPPPDSYDNLQPQYPSLAFPPAGPSQPPHQHYPPSGGWQYNPYYGQQPYAPHPGGPHRPHANGGGFQPAGGYRYDQGYQAYPYPAPFYPAYGQMPVPGPGPGTMQNGYYMPPNYQRPYPGFDGDGGPTGDENGFNGGMPFQPQPFYPPGHPYAYGGGVGYHQQMPPFNGGGYPVPEHPHMPPTTASKALNPAAAGFTFQPRKEMNGTMANGRAREEDIVAPVPEKLESSLGLSLEPEKTGTTAVAEAVKEEIVEEKREEEDKEEKVEKGEQKEKEEKEEKEEAAPVEEEPVKEEALVEPVPESIKFTGPTVPGYASPVLHLRTPKVSDPILVRPSRPSPDSAGNSFAAYLTVPELLNVETVDGARHKRSLRVSPKPRGKAVFAVGVRGGRKPPAISLQFGEIKEVLSTPTPPPKILPPSPPSATASTPATGPASTSAPVTAPASTSTPTSGTPTSPPPKPKAFSWAAVVRAPSAARTPDALSVAPSSTLPSPSRSTASLPSEAGPSRTSDPTTPRSAAAPSTAATPAQRPAFNYAAAAAVGAPPTPAEDLARLLTEGVRPRSNHAPAPVVPRGLINTGNMCFANTILQVLVYCTPFTELFEELGKRLKADLARRTPLLEAMIVFLREFAPKAPGSGTATPKGKDRDPNEAFVPENVYDAMKENKRFDSMRRGYQEDAEEYLGFFLNTLHEELLSLYSRTAPGTVVKSTATNGSSERTINRPVSPGAGGDKVDDWLEVGKKQKTHVVRQAESKESSVSRIFGGTLRSVLHTPGQKDSVTLEPYQPLQLDVQDPKVNTIVDALRHLNEPETVGGVWSQSRRENVDATKQVYIDSFPSVLILHLKRFVYDPQEQNVVKRDKPVAYGAELVIPQEIISAPKRTNKPVTYRLFGVVYHHGHSATGGHYTVAVARPDGTGWLHFDDEAVQPLAAESVVVSEDEVRSGRAGLIGTRERCAYLLFYQRIR